jgi:putative FmdB family regulatory protein
MVSHVLYNWGRKSNSRKVTFMPLYEYECEACGIRFERRQSFSENPVNICPECGGNVHRLIQPVGIVFKGSGFYVTDNRAKSSTATPGKKSSNGDSGSESDSNKKASSEKTDSASD